MSPEISLLYLSKAYWEIIYFFSQTLMVLIVLVGAIIAYGQLRRTKESIRIENTFKFYEIFRTREFQKDLFEMRQMTTIDPSTPEESKAWLEKQHGENESFKSVMSFFNQLGIHLKKGFVSKELIKETYQITVQDIWNQCKRKNIEIDDFSNFKYLVDNLKDA